MVLNVFFFFFTGMLARTWLVGLASYKKPRLGDHRTANWEGFEGVIGKVWTVLP